MAITDSSAPAGPPEQSAALAARLQQAVAHHREGRVADAERIYREILALAPDHFDALHLLGVAATQRGDHAAAAALIRAAIAANPLQPAAHSNLGLALQRSGDLAGALLCFDRAVNLNANSVAARYNRGNVLRGLGRPADALADYDRALALNPDDAGVLCNRGNALRDLARPAEAVASYDLALVRNPGDADALFNRGLALAELGRPAEALASLDRARQCNPDDALVHFHRGNLLQALRRHAEAVSSYDRALLLQPANVAALNNRGNALRELRRFDAALASYERALALAPDHVEALNNRGSVLRDLLRSADALASYERALAVRPDHAETLYNRASLLQALQRYAEAAACFAQLVAVAPDFDYALGAMHECRMHCCDWTEADQTAQRIVAAVNAGAKAVTPFALLAVSPSAQVQLRCARTYMADRFAPAPVALWRGERYGHERVRLAYLSADLREHPVGYLLAELFERHDRRRFETVALSYGAVVGSPMRRRLQRAFERFIDVGGRSDAEVAALLREQEIDIAVDLGGITAEARSGVLARRAVPLQVNYVGYPGSLGAPYVDYLIADGYVVPAGRERDYAEQVVRLPDSFQATDATRGVPVAPARAQLGLPEAGFVFCAFNASYKITPALFGVWLRLLRAVAGSVLWLVGDAVVAGNLRRAAAAGGVAPQRLVVAPRVSYGEHLARCAAADLFLDTLPFNGGSTVSDALWAGLPVLSCSGEAFAGRMAGSLLRAVGLAELIAADLGAYEARGRELATDAQQLARLKARLAAGRTTAPLFDSGRYCRHLEAAYLTMWQRQQRGEPPQAFAVAPIA